MLVPLFFLLDDANLCRETACGPPRSTRAPSSLSVISIGSSEGRSGGPRLVRRGCSSLLTLARSRKLGNSLVSNEEPQAMIGYFFPGFSL